MRRLRVLISSVLVTGMGLAAALGLARPGFAAVLECPSGDVPCLIAAINAANANGEVNTIRLATGAYTLTAADNDTDGPNGLPSITSALTIAGAGAGNTSIERETTAPAFRLVHVGQAGLLKLEGLTLRGGFHFSTPSGPGFGGGAIRNHGTVMISQSTVADNVSRQASGGGIINFGRLVVAGSTIANNRSTAGFGGGLASFGLTGVTVVNSTISGNIGETGGGLAILEGSVTIIGSTIANNLAAEGSGGGLQSFVRNVTIINSTLAHNRNRFGAGGALNVGGGIIVNSTIAYNTGTVPSTLGAPNGALALQNTILSGTSSPGFPMCGGAVTSLDNNFFSDPKCAVTLLPQDQTGDPGLGTFTDDGTPGRGHVPLVAGSPALGAGNDAACLPTDQRGQLRVGGGCDIGAIEGPRP
jgi:hypothetical protein